jgi:hypothetical protein
MPLSFGADARGIRVERSEDGGLAAFATSCLSSCRWRGEAAVGYAQVPASVWTVPPGPLTLAV